MNNKVLFYILYGVLTAFFYFMDGWRAFAVILTILGVLLLATEPYKIRNKQLANKFRNNVETLKEYDKDFKADGSFTSTTKKYRSTNLKVF